MKYTGRICTIMILLILEPIYIIYYYNKMGYIDKINIINIPLLLLIAWFLGKYFDKVQFYSQELKKAKEELQQIFDNVDAALWSCDEQTNTLLVSAGIEKIYGLSRQSFLDNPTICHTVIHPDDLNTVKKYDEELSLGKSSEVIYRISQSTNEIRWVKEQGCCIFDSYGNLVKTNGIVFDITNQKLVEERYKKLEENYRNLIEVAPIGIIIHQSEKIVYINSVAAKFLGTNNANELINKSIFDVVHPEFHQTVIMRMKKIIENKENTSLNEYKLINNNGTTINVEMISTNITFNDHPAVLTMIIDITERKKVEKQINQLAYYDNLTGLPNRNLIREQFNYLISGLKNKERTLGVLFLDLDRFKNINYSLGHPFGDLILQQVAKRLLKCVYKDDVVCRYGGDEFIILLKDRSEIEISQLAQKIIDEISHSFLVNEQEVHSSVSIGISLYPKNSEKFETLIQYADTALFHTKEQGKKHYQFYSNTQSESVSKKIRLENDLRRAIENEEFILYYQPQFNLNTGQIIGVEALIRWQHPELGMISPAEFIPLAEETGLIIPIGEWVLKTACKQNKIWQQIGYPSIYVAVNISVYQFQSNNFIQTIEQVLKETRLAPKYLELEMTESILQNKDQLSSLFNELKNIGVKLSLDDFGTGYSSLSILKHLPIDTLKIDKSFIDDIATNVDSSPITKTIIDMSKNLKLNVIAEGIENKEQVKFLKQHQCDMGQGYFFSRPVLANEVIWNLTNNKVDLNMPINHL